MKVNNGKHASITKHTDLETFYTLSKLYILGDAVSNFHVMLPAAGDDDKLLMLTYSP